MIRDHQLAAAVPGRRPGQQVPADFVQDGEIVKGLPGLLTMLPRRRLRRPRGASSGSSPTPTSPAARSTRSARTAAPRSSAAPRPWPSDRWLTVRVSRSTRQLLALVWAVVLAVVWWLTQHGGDADDRARPRASDRSTYRRTDPGPRRPRRPRERAAAGGRGGPAAPRPRETLALIDAGGPFPLRPRTACVFENRERILPAAERAATTASTPCRRPARTIAARDASSRAARGEYYWTEDHYASFERIDTMSGLAARPGRTARPRHLPLARQLRRRRRAAHRRARRLAVRPPRRLGDRAQGGVPGRRRARRSPSPTTTGRTSTRWPTACPTCPPTRCCSGTAGGRSPAPSGPFRVALEVLGAHARRRADRAVRRAAARRGPDLPGVALPSTDPPVSRAVRDALNGARGATQRATEARLTAREWRQRTRAVAAAARSRSAARAVVAHVGLVERAPAPAAASSSITASTWPSAPEPSMIAAQLLDRARVAARCPARRRAAPPSSAATRVERQRDQHGPLALDQVVAGGLAGRPPGRRTRRAGRRAAGTPRRAAARTRSAPRASRRWRRPARRRRAAAARWSTSRTCSAAPSSPVSTSARPRACTDTSRN